MCESVCQLFCQFEGKRHQLEGKRHQKRQAILNKCTVVKENNLAQLPPSWYDASFKEIEVFKKITYLILCALLALPYSVTLAFDTAFYTTNGSDPLQDIKSHHQSITILLPQAYQVHADGTVTVRMKSDLMKLTNQYSIKLMPFFTNAAFDMNKVDQFLKNTNAQNKAIQSILQLCQNNHFYGVQIDFEHIPVADKALFTAFYKHLATTMHQYHYKISVAIIPLLYPKLPTLFLTAHYNHWSGAYDEKQLGQYSDFVTLMAYDQHSDFTTPGPVAGYPWVKKVIEIALQNIPRQKLLLGIPTYSTHWGYKMVRINGNTAPIANGDEIGHNDVIHLMNEQNIILQWDNSNKIHFSIYSHYMMNEYLFVEDADSFKHKLELAKTYGLRGIAVFALGIEDPKIWSALDEGSQNHRH